MFPGREDELKSHIAVMRLATTTKSKTYQEAAKAVIRLLNPAHRMALKHLIMIGPLPVEKREEPFKNLIELGLAVKVAWRAKMTHVAATELGYEALMSYSADRQTKIMIGTNS